jgi:hypothetical protein
MMTDEGEGGVAWLRNHDDGTSALKEEEFILEKKKWRTTIVGLLVILTHSFTCNLTQTQICGSVECLVKVKFYSISYS